MLTSSRGEGSGEANGALELCVSTRVDERKSANIINTMMSPRKLHQPTGGG